MDIILVILFIGLLLCAVMLGASRNPKAKEIIDDKAVKTLTIYTVGIIVLIVIIGIARGFGPD